MDVACSNELLFTIPVDSVSCAVQWELGSVTASSSSAPKNGAVSTRDVAELRKAAWSERLAANSREHPSLPTAALVVGHRLVIFLYMLQEVD